MAEETFMLLKVDLGCPRCYKKVKKLLCKYSEIRDQAFYEKEDTVVIKVVCCNPERIRSKLICKSDGAIKSIEIRKPEKPAAEKPPAKPEAETPGAKPAAQTPAAKPAAETPAAKPAAETPVGRGRPRTPVVVKDGKQNDDKSGDKASSQKSEPVPAPVAVAGYPQFFPVAVCCNGPCQHGYGVPYQPPPQPSSYEGHVRLLPSYGERSYGGWSSGCRCNRSYGCRCHWEYVTEENPSCTIM